MIDQWGLGRMLSTLMVRCGVLLFSVKIQGDELCFVAISPMRFYMKLSY